MLYTEESTVKSATHRIQRSLPGFRSFKTSKPIYYPMRWHFNLLVQLTLDKRIDSIRQLTDFNNRDIFKLLIESKNCIRVLVPVNDGQHDGLEHGAGSLIVPRSAVLAEPGHSNARTIWATRKVPIPAALRFRVITVLENHPNGISISDLMTSACREEVQPLEAILAMACVGLAVLDLSGPLAPRTIVWPGTPNLHRWNAGEGTGCECG